MNIEQGASNLLDAPQAKVPVENFMRSGTFLVQAIEGRVRGDDRRRNRPLLGELKNWTGAQWVGEEKRDHCPKEPK
jgi:hypothetical protein